MSETSTVPAKFLAAFGERERELATHGPQWLRDLRRKKRARFDALGLPDTRQEAWKNTSLAPLRGVAFHPATPDTAATTIPGDLPDLGGTHLVFRNGRLISGLSSTPATADGVEVLSLARALETMPDALRPWLEQDDTRAGEEFRELNAALGEDGAVVRVADDTQLEAPVQLTFLSGGAGNVAAAAHPRTLVIVGRNSRLRLVESYLGEDRSVYLTNAVSEVSVGPGSVVDHYRLQLESENAFHISTIASRQDRDSRYTSYNINLGGRLTRNHVFGVLAGEGAYCDLNGLSATHDSQHVDNHTILDHASPHCGSRELYKGILGDRSRTVFSGRIVVRKDAQKTDAKQSNPNLLLSADALAYTRPQLEIYADDVRCTHGATIGQMDADAVFYLRTRGIPEKQARELLVHAFAGEVLERIELEPLRDWLETKISARLGQMGQP